MIVSGILIATAVMSASKNAIALRTVAIVCQGQCSAPKLLLSSDILANQPQLQSIQTNGRKLVVFMRQTIQFFQIVEHIKRTTRIRWLMLSIREVSMFANGPWKGFWKQDSWGRQEMEQFELAFSNDGFITGKGTDVIGIFVFRGHFDTTTGDLTMTKQYLGKHQVDYRGRPDGEGRIVGSWDIGGVWNGPFSLHPVVTGREPIQELTK
jgi:hypothetical protein